MNDVIDIAAEVIMLAGAALALLAAIGLMKFETSTARFHSAGKASPVAFLVTAVGAGIALGWTGFAALMVAVIAMVFTLPIGVHLLFRADHKDGQNGHLTIDELADDQAGERTTPISEG